MLCSNGLVPQLIFYHIFNSASRQHHEVWASQVPFLHGLKDVVPLSEACLYDCLNWSLAQAQQQSSMGLSQYFPPKRDGKTRLRTEFISVYKRDICQSLVVPLWLRGLTCRVGLRLVQVAGSLLVIVSLPVLLMLGRRGAMGISAPDVSHSTASSSFLSSVLQVGMPSHLFGLVEKNYFQQLCA